MPTITLNSTNITRSGNNVLTYEFQNGGATFKNNDISLASFTCYYSWFNLSAQYYRNTTLYYRWIDGEIVPFTIPDGQYSVEQLNAYLQSVMVANKHYMINVSTGNFFYYLQLVENPTFYSIQLNAYLTPLPADVPTIYTYPVGALWVLPAIPITPQLGLYISEVSAFNSLIGFTANALYPPTPSTVQYSHLSDFTPELEPVSALNLLCSFISNPFSPYKVIYSTGIPSVAFGQQINVVPPNFLWNKITDGLFQTFTIEIVDQNNYPIGLKDPQINIVLNIKDRGTNQ